MIFSFLCSLDKIYSISEVLSLFPREGNDWGKLKTPWHLCYSSCIEGLVIKIISSVWGFTVSNPIASFI